ncbi:MAG: aminotransferase class III-fold pyridoxal phosphate-dependent enzyme [Alphaproteobacteria bacterium]|nr:aminotransferase class III-fold pyridoxal phosphate-dependent enzyme [Alphaproteobacteria bacterium]
MWQARAKAVLPAGGFGNFDPGFFARGGKGSRVWDENGDEFIDYLISSGPMILGHGHPEVIEAVQEQISTGMTFFANNSKGVVLAEMMVEAVACAEQIRYVSTGGEADMYAMRLARAHTGRPKILKFEGGYHGMSAEALMSLAPARLENFPNPVPDSAGIPSSVEDGVIVGPYNDIEFARAIISEYSGQIAGIIVEPLQRIIPPVPGFLEALREEASNHGIVLIFDEVVTGFRMGYGGAQERYGVVPDLTTLGKIIGGGFPLAAIAGSAELMAHFDKSIVGEDGFTMQVGTLSGNPVASVAGIKTLEVLKREGAYETIIGHGKRLMTAASASLDKHGVPHRIVGDPVLFDVVFTDRDVRNYRDVKSANTAQAAVFNRTMRDCGILKPAGKMYPHLALTEADLQQTEHALERAAKAVADQS